VEQITCALVEDDGDDETMARDGENVESATLAAESDGDDALTSAASARAHEEL
jgi:hypothetical protein